MGFDVSKDRFGYAGGFEANSDSGGGSSGRARLIYEWQIEDVVAVDSAPVGNWLSHAGGINLGQPGGAAQPLFKTAITPSGKPVLRFDGVDDILVTPVSISNAVHIFLIAGYRPASPPTYNELLGTASPDGDEFLLNPGSPIFAAVGTHYRDGLLTNNCYVNGQFALYECVRSTPTSTVSLFIGAKYNGSNSAVDIAYVGLSAKEVTGAALANIRSRLSDTYLAPLLTIWQNLISYWKLDEASGNAIDAKGVNDLTDTGGVGAGTGKINGARSFVAASAQYLSIASNQSLQIGDIDFTVSGWVNLTDKSAARTIATKRGATPEWLLRYDPGVGFSFWVSPNGSTYTTAYASSLGDPALSTWYYVVGWHDSVANTINIQVNNGPVNSVAHSTGVWVGTEIFALGAVAGYGEYFDGLIDEVGFWKKVLTPIERTWLYNNGSGRTYDDAQNFIQAAGITDATQQSAIKTLVTDLKTAGIWSKCQAIYPMVGGNATAHKFNLKDPRDLDAAFRLSFNGGWTHSPTGALPANAYADTHYILATHGTNNSSHLSVYSRTNSGTNFDMYAIGGANFGMAIKALPVSGNYLSDVYAQGANRINVGPIADSRGMFIDTRTGPTVHKAFQNGAVIGSEASASAGFALVTISLYLGGSNASGTPGNYSDNEYAFASIGTGLSDADAAAFNTAVQKFQGTLGRSVAMLDKLVSWWKMDEPTGGPISDAHGSNTLTNSGNAPSVAGKVGNAKNLRASQGEYFYTPDNASLSVAGQTSFTFAIWTKLTSFQDYSALMGKWADPGSNREYTIIYIPTGNVLQFAVTYDGFNGIAGVSTDAITTGVWYYVVAWYDKDAQTLNIQLNNGAVRSIAYSAGIFDGAASFAIGKAETWNLWDGLIDEGAFWKRALTAAERTYLYNSGNGRAYTDLGSSV